MNNNDTPEDRLRQIVREEIAAVLPQLGEILKSAIDGNNTYKNFPSAYLTDELLKLSDQLLKGGAE